MNFVTSGVTVTGIGRSSLSVESSTREGFDSMRNDLDEAATTVKGEMGRRRRAACFFADTLVVGSDKRPIFIGDLPRFSGPLSNETRKRANDTAKTNFAIDTDYWVLASKI